jgi:hypothetical protein
MRITRLELNLGCCTYQRCCPQSQNAEAAKQAMVLGGVTCTASTWPSPRQPMLAASHRPLHGTRHIIQRAAAPFSAAAATALTSRRAMFTSHCFAETSVHLANTVELQRKRVRRGRSIITASIQLKTHPVHVSRSSGCCTCSCSTHTCRSGNVAVTKLANGSSSAGARSNAGNTAAAHTSGAASIAKCRNS